jgi:hypothetical protein
MARAVFEIDPGSVEMRAADPGATKEFRTEAT